MESLALKLASDASASIVHRSHDLSGCDYATVIHVPRDIADMIDARGVAVWTGQAIHNGGRPGIVLSGANAKIEVELRADVADPTTAIDRVQLDPVTALRLVPIGGATRIHWIIPPRT